MGIQRPRRRGMGGPSGLVSAIEIVGTRLSGDRGANIKKTYGGTNQTTMREGMGWLPRMQTRAGANYLSTQDTAKIPSRVAPGMTRGSDVGDFPSRRVSLSGSQGTTPFRVRR